MRIIHCADLHLSFTAYPRLTPSGINQREADVGKSFANVVTRAIELEPDLFVIGGDLFHSSRPSNRSIVHAFTQLARLTKSLPRCAVIAVSGNHDCGRASESGTIVRLFSEAGVHVADRHAERFYFPDRDLAVLAIPDSPGNVRPAFTLDARARYNVALIHGEVEGMPRAGGTAEHEITTGELDAAAWSYVALGHYHVYREIAPNCFYSGATDYTSSDIWGERREEIASGIAGKGFIEHDLDSGAHTFHEIPGVRSVFDLPSMDAEGMTPDDINTRIADRLADVPDGAIVRLIVNEIPRDVGHALDQKMLREAKRRFLHFNLDLRRPDPMERIREVTTERKKQLERLPDRVRRTFSERELPADVDRGEFVSKGMEYFGETEDAASSLLQQQLTESLEKSE